MSRHLGGLAQATLARIPHRSDGAGRVVVLCYHSVSRDTTYSSATPELFKQHLEWLRQHCDIVPLARVFDHVGAGATRPTVAVTFDDGHADNFDAAFPLLREFAIPATVFVTNGLIERDPQVLARVASDLGVSLGDLWPLTWQQIETMRDGGIEIGAHTLTHPNFIRLSEEAAAAELTDAKARLEVRLGAPVESLAYPYGIPGRHFDASTMRLAREAGYRRACAVLYRDVRERDSIFAIPRISVTGDSVAMLRAKIAGSLDVVGRWQESAPRWATRVVSSPGLRNV